MSIKQMVRCFLMRLGLDLIRYDPKSHPLAQRQRMLDAYGIDLVLDVGANAGQFGRQMRNIGYIGRMISFEPIKICYSELVRNAASDSMWEAKNCALGDVTGSTEINVAGNLQSSSLLGMQPFLGDLLPESQYTRKEQIELLTLDSVFDELRLSAASIYLKLDTQGFEKKVLDGAEKSLPLIDTIQLEMSLVPLYEGELLFDEMHKLMKLSGFSLVAIEPGFCDEKTGRLIQIDGIYHRFK